MNATNYSGTKGFFSWFKTAQPALYMEFLKRWNSPDISSTLGSVGDDSSVSFGTDVSVITDPSTTTTEAPMSSDIASTVAQVANAAANVMLTQAQIQQQNTILQTQLTRAQQGLPPLALNPNSYGLSATVSATPLSSSTLLIIGAVVIGAIVLSKK